MPARNRADDPERSESDEALAAKVKLGDRDALERLVRRYVRPVHAVAASYLTDPAAVDDAVQEVFLRVIRAIGSFDARRPFAPWLYQIARNVARTQRTFVTKSSPEPLPETLGSTLTPPDVTLERAEIRARIDAAIARLPEQRRTAFYLTEVEGFDTSEVARMMGLSRGTVRSHLHHARAGLRAALRDQLERTGGPKDE
jgi:RNA polymerase sigma-70 factor (ECF subfamily)